MDRVKDCDLPEHLVCNNSIAVRVSTDKCVVFDMLPYLRVYLRDNQISWDSDINTVFVNGVLPFAEVRLHYEHPDKMTNTRSEVVYHNGEHRDCRTQNLSFVHNKSQRKGPTVQSFLNIEKKALQRFSSSSPVH